MIKEKTIGSNGRSTSTITVCTELGAVIVVVGESGA